MHPRCCLLADTIAILQLLRVFRMHQRREVAAVVEDEVEFLAVLEGSQLLLQTPLVLFFCLAFPCEDRRPGCGDCGCGVVLCGEDVAGGPRHFGAEGCEGFDKDGGLDGCGGVTISKVRESCE